MNMNEPSSIAVLSIAVQSIAGFVAGLAIGAGFFRLLAHSVARLPTATRPALLMVASLVARMLLAAAGFLLVARIGGLPATGGALLGFVAARTWLIGARRQ